MKDSSLISLLRTFSKLEMNRFEKFLLSPYFSERSRIRINKVNEYFRVLKKFYPDFEGKNFTGENLYKTIYPGTKFKDYSIRKLNSDLLKLAEKFLMQQEFENSEIESRKFLLNQLTHRNQEKLFRKCFESMIEYLNGLKKDEDYFYETYFVWQRYWEIYYGKKNIYKLGKVIENTDNYFIYVVLGALRIYLWAISYSKVANSSNDLMMIEEILNYVENNMGKFRKVPQILFYYYLIRLISEKEEKYFDKLKELKAHHFDSLTDPDKQNFFIMMTNFCNVMIQSGNEKFKKERFELDKGYLNLIRKLNLHSMHVFYILGASKNANRLGEFEWVTKILEEFEKFTMDDNKEFMVNYIKADVCFLKKEYDKAIEYLSKINTNYSNQKQNIRNLMIQIFYEKSQMDSVLSLIDSSRHFLKRDKHLSENTKINSLNFIRFTEMLIRLPNKPAENEYRYFRSKLSETTVVLNKEWLMEKLDSI